MSEQQSAQPRILKIAICTSLSGRTGITYHVGCRGKDEVCFRIWDTSGKGIFSKEWVCAADIQKVLAQQEVLTAPSLLPVFKAGRSVNTSGYLLAVLKQEGLVALSPDEPHKYLRTQSESFVKEVAELIKEGVSLDELADGPEPQRASKGKGRRTAGVPAWNAATQGTTPQSE